MHWARQRLEKAVSWDVECLDVISDFCVTVDWGAEEAIPFEPRLMPQLYVAIYHVIRPYIQLEVMHVFRCMIHLIHVHA